MTPSAPLQRSTEASAGWGVETSAPEAQDLDDAAAGAHAVHLLSSFVMPPAPASPG